jgi:hypothetical protein
MSALRIGTREGLFDLNNGDCKASIEKRRITHLARHGISWWAVADRSEILYQEAPDVAWRSVGTLRGAEITSLFATPWGLLLGTSRARLFRLYRGAFEPISALDNVPDRDRWHAPTGDIQTRSLALGSGGSLYVNIHVGGVLRSLDKGANFETTGLDIESDVHQIAAHPDASGLVWRVVTDGLHATYQRAVAIAGDMVVVSASTGPGGGRAALYRTSIHGLDRFERCREGLPEWFTGNINTGCLAARGTEIAAGDPRGIVYLSGNAGGIWREIVATLPPIHCLSFA